MTANPPDTRGIDTFRSKIYARYREHPRPLPWRGIDDPYRILVSEFMLQQTQVERVTGKYGPFLDIFPDIRTLENAPFEQVFAAWRGLGYNRRALNLHETARMIVEQFGGTIPRDPDILETLPGIGRTTARAIAAFAFQVPAAFIETNIRRVFIHFFFEEEDGVRDRDILPIAEAALDRTNPRDWHYALMDYGVFLGKAVPNPNLRSAHHHRQSPFEGSLRQIRGAVLRELSSAPAGTRDTTELAGALHADRERLETVLDALVREGFLVVEKERYRMR